MKGHFRDQEAIFLPQNQAASRDKLSQKSNDIKVTLEVKGH